jgi:predicted hydrocarbon binding protein
MTAPPPELHDCELPVPVRVDPATFAWSVDGMPVLLIPRHLWVSVQKSLEAGLGLEGARALFRAAGHGAARTWCTRQGERFDLAGVPLFEHYLRSASRRGYGRMVIERIDLEHGRARVRVDGSVYVAEYGQNAGRAVCHVFESSFAGGLDCASERAGLPGDWTVRETACAANGATHCTFEMRRA